MRRFWPIQVLVWICVLILPEKGVCQNDALALSDSSETASSSATTNDAAVLAQDDLAIPSEMQRVMSAAQRCYLEGSLEIKSGESDKARAAFNKAVDLLLQSGYDLNSSPVLKRFFEDLIQRIQEDESCYLKPPGDPEEEAESAVVDELDALDLIPIKIDPSLQDAATADLLDTEYDIPITLNDKVLEALDYWLNRGRKYFADGLVRSGRYQEMIARIFRDEGLPLDLMYLAQVESLFKTNALSRAQAKGIWQFGKGTAIRYGLKVNSYVDERSDPEKSTRAAARYLSDLYAMFKDWNLVLAAYNWGEGKVLKLMERSGLSDFWELSDLKRKLPKETKNHVPLIQASIILARNPEKYGLPRTLDAPLAYDLVSVSKPVDLRAAAKIFNITLEELKQLNPSLRGLSTPPNYPEFQLKVPAGGDSALLQQIAELPAVKLKPAVVSGSRYKVQPGDTFSSIAQRYRISLAELQRANAGVSAKSLRAGSWIQLPKAVSSRRSTATSKANSSAANTNAKKTSVDSKASGTAKKSSSTSGSGKNSVKTPSSQQTKSLADSAKPPASVAQSKSKSSNNSAASAKKAADKEVSSR
jgi:membrane-bound lytic murein transglycosylase D